MLACDGGEGLVGELTAPVILVVDDHLVAHLDVEADHAVVLHGGNGQGVGEGAGLAHGVQGHVGIVQVAHAAQIHVVLSHFGPGAGVAGGDGDHGVGLAQLVHDGLEHGVIVGTTAGGHGAQGQVHHVGTQDDGVLDGGEVVGVIGAAALAEDLHGQQLGLGSHTLDIDGIQCLDKAVAVGDVGVGGSDTGNMGAVLALLVVVVGDVVVGILIIVAEGQLGADVSQRRIDGDVQITGDSGDLGGIQQIQGRDRDRVSKQ